VITLGLDPGLANVGWAVLAGREVLASGVFRTKGTPKVEREALRISAGADKMRRADEIGSFLLSALEVFRVGLVAHEGISLGFHQSTTLLDMGLAFGAIASAAAAAGARRVEVRPREVKDWAARVLGQPAEGLGKDAVVDAARRQTEGSAWPKATALWEHVGDAIAVATIASSAGWVTSLADSPIDVAVAQNLRNKRRIQADAIGESLRGKMLEPLVVGKGEKPTFSPAEVELALRGPDFARTPPWPLQSGGPGRAP
jgi:Holliday junction resolvasome RuvABC endonuclease subunit